MGAERRPESGRSLHLVTMLTPHAAAHLAEYQGPLLASGIMVWQKYAYMILGGAASMEGAGPQKLKWEARAFGNYNEQFPLVMVALWMHALFYNPIDAVHIGYAYVAFRFAYIIIWLLDWSNHKDQPFPNS